MDWKGMGSRAASAVGNFARVEAAGVAGGIGGAAYGMFSDDTSVLGGATMGAIGGGMSARFLAAGIAGHASTRHAKVADAMKAQGFNPGYGGAFKMVAMGDWNRAKGTGQAAWRAAANQATNAKDLFGNWWNK